MKTASAAKIAAEFDEYLRATRDQPVLITRNGKAVAILMAVQDKAEAEQIAVGRSRTLRSIFEEASDQIQEGGGIPHDEFWRQVKQARGAKQPAASRAKKRVS